MTPRDGIAYTDSIPSSGENSKPQNRRYSITPEFANWFEAQTEERLAVSREYLDADGHPIYDPARLADKRSGWYSKNRIGVLQYRPLA